MTKETKEKRDRGRENRGQVQNEKRGNDKKKKKGVGGNTDVE